MTSFKFKKAVQALVFFASKNQGVINYVKAIKLIWLSDRTHLRRYGRTITNDRYVAMKNGPVPSNTKDIVQKSLFFEKEDLAYADEYLSAATNYDYSALKNPDLNVFSKTDIKVMEEVYSKMGGLNQFQLSDFSHKFPEWKRYELQLESGIGKVFDIVDADFFEPNYEISLFNQSDELLELSKTAYSEVS